MRARGLAATVMILAACTIVLGPSVKAASGDVAIQIIAEGNYRTIADSAGQHLDASAGKTFVILVVGVRNQGRDAISADPDNFVLDTRTSHVHPEAVRVSVAGVPPCDARLSVPAHAALQCVLVFQVNWEGAGDLTYADRGLSVRVRFYRCGIVDPGDFASAYSPPCL